MVWSPACQAETISDFTSPETPRHPLIILKKVVDSRVPTKTMNDFLRKIGLLAQSNIDVFSYNRQQSADIHRTSWVKP